MRMAISVITIKRERPNGRNLGSSRRHIDGSKSKTHKYKKLRPLVKPVESRNTKHELFEWRNLPAATAFIIATVAFLMATYTQNNNRTKDIVKGFLNDYRKQYTQIVYGKDYCDQWLDVSAIFGHIRQEVIHQNQALEQLELILHTESDINSIALVGPVGVGKSRFVQALQRYFPWQTNVHSYDWNTYVRDEAEKFRLLRLLVENLSECGRNLLLIDNLKPCDHEVISIVNKLLKETTTANGVVKKRVLLFYVFTLNTMLSATHYRLQHEMLQKLDNTEVVNFKPFGRLELKDCIRREAMLENLTLSGEDFDEIVETIDPSLSGCKNVRAKVLMYGTIKARNVF